MAIPLTLSEVPDVTPYIQYVASSGQTVFPYPFPITQDSDLVVVINGVTQPTDSGYSLSGQGNDTGGNLTFTNGQTTGTIVTLYRDIAIERITQIGQNSGFSSTAFNAEFNNLYLIAQQLETQIGQCLQLPNTNNPAPVTTLTPAAYANKYLSFDQYGNPQPAALTSSGAITQAIIGGLLYPQTAAEEAAGVTPTYEFYPPGALERYGASTASPNNSVAINAALSCNTEVFSVYGWLAVYPVSAVLVVPANTRLRDCAFIGTGNLSAYAPFAGDWQGQLICLTGAGATAQHVRVNGANYYCGGVVAAAIANPAVIDCWIENTGASPNSLAQGILFISCTGINIQGNYVYNTLDGIQHASCTGGAITGNVVDITGQAGIWGTSSIGLSITGNSISNCGDVGLDMESGQNCVTSGNQVSSANNGELTWFSGSSGQSPSNCLFTANVCWRTPTYLAMVAGVPTATACASSGALFIESVYAGSGGQNGIAFLGNEFYNTHSTSYAFLVNAVSISAVTSGITVESNYFFSTAVIHYVQQCWDLVVKGNVFYGNGSTAAGADNLYKNPANGVWSKNLYYFDTARTANAALHYYTDGSLVAGGVGPVISDNEFYNCGTYAMIHDPANSGPSATLSGNKLYIPEGLSLTTVWPANGGLTCTTNGYPIYAGQDLYLGATGTATAAIDFGTTTPLMGSCYVGTGELMVCSGSAQGASYGVVATPGAIASRDGSGSNSGIPASTTRYATFATPNVTATGPGSTTTIMNVKLSLQS
jgi:hypothetical protein